MLLDKPRIVVLNKIDQISAEDSMRILNDLQTRFSGSFLDFIGISAKECININKLTARWREIIDFYDDEHKDQMKKHFISEEETKQIEIYETKKAKRNKRNFVSHLIQLTDTILV